MLIKYLYPEHVPLCLLKESTQIRTSNTQTRTHTVCTYSGVHSFTHSFTPYIHIFTYYVTYLHTYPYIIYMHTYTYVNIPIYIHTHTWHVSVFTNTSYHPFQFALSLLPNPPSAPNLIPFLFEVRSGYLLQYTPGLIPDYLIAVAL